MSFNEMTPADIRACTCNNDGDGMFGGNGAWWIIILLLFGWGRNGFGGWGGNGNGNGCSAPCATQADVRAAVDQQTLISKLDNAVYGLSDSTYALNNAITNGFHGAERSAWDISRQISDCCCGIKGEIKDVAYANAMNTNQLDRRISDCCCDIEKMNMQNRFDMQTYNCNTLQAIDASTDRIIKYLADEKAQALRDENQALRLAASQSAQNAFITANQEAQTAELIRRLNPTPTPAYVVPNPNCCYNPQVTFNTCGCGAY